MIDADLLSRYRFFRQHAGGIVGRNAEGAIALARADRLIEAAAEEDVARVEWADDEEPYEHGVYTLAEIAAKFESNEWSGPYGCVIYIEGEVAESLWGITLGPADLNDPYARVVVAELAAQCEDDLRQALGDHLDMVENLALRAAAHAHNPALTAPPTERSAQ